MKYYFVFCKEELLLKKCEDGSYTIPLQEEPPVEVKSWTNVMNISPLDGIEVKTFRIDSPVTELEDYEMCGLRKSYYKLPKPMYLKAGKCQELLYWDQNTKYCGICGAPMRMDTDISKKCTECGKEIWPQLATAVAVAREAMEETGVSITNIRYFGSQPWPYPCGLMVGFHADYVSGEIHLQQSEIAKGGWFRRDNLPQIPEKLSIARMLLDDWLGSV